jgi:hypothetical protein
LARFQAESAIIEQNSDFFFGFTPGNIFSLTLSHERDQPEMLHTTAFNECMHYARFGDTSVLQNTPSWRRRYWDHLNDQERAVVRDTSIRNNYKKWRDRAFAALCGNRELTPLERIMLRPQDVREAEAAFIRETLYRREVEIRARYVKIAVEKAEELLLDLLDDEQRAEYEKYRRFHLKLAWSGLTLQFRDGVRTGNLGLLHGDDPRDYGGLCVHPQEDALYPDQLACQLLHAKYNEIHIIAQANNYDGRWDARLYAIHNLYKCVAEEYPAGAKMPKYLGVVEVDPLLPEYVPHLRELFRGIAGLTVFVQPPLYGKPLKGAISFAATEQGQKWLTENLGDLEEIGVFIPQAIAEAQRYQNQRDDHNRYLREMQRETQSRRQQRYHNRGLLCESFSCISCDERRRHQRRRSIYSYTF